MILEPVKAYQIERNARIRRHRSILIGDQEHAPHIRSGRKGLLEPPLGLFAVQMIRLLGRNRGGSLRSPLGESRHGLGAMLHSQQPGSTEYASLYEG